MSYATGRTFFDADSHIMALPDFLREHADPDARSLIGVGATTLDDPDAAMAELERIIALGLGAVWIPHRPAGGRSPGHNDLDRFWARLAEAGLPALLHVGGTSIQLSPDWMNTGRPVPTDSLCGGR